MAKKKKRNESEAEVDINQNELKCVNSDSHEKIDERKKKKKQNEENCKESNQRPTVSIALPGSIIHNAQSIELATRGLLPPLDAPHHLRKHEWGTYHEGVTVKVPPLDSGGSLADVGLNKNVVIDQALEPGTRVTVAMGTNRQLDDKPRKVVSSSMPREEAGLCTGVIKVCDHLIGTSEHGLFIKSSELTLPPFRHLLIAFGGLAGLEECFEEDKNLKGKKPDDVFHSYLNVCPNQGSRPI